MIYQKAEVFFILLCKVHFTDDVCVKITEVRQIPIHHQPFWVSCFRFRIRTGWGEGWRQVDGPP
jgi:hypothetical protein